MLASAGQFMAQCQPYHSLLPRLLLGAVCNVTLLLLRENNIQPLYFRIKSYVCCDLTDAIYSVWVPWTCAGVLALVLCILATARIVSSTLRPSGTTGRPSDDDPAPDKVRAGRQQQMHGQGAVSQDLCPTDPCMCAPTAQPL